MNYSTYDHLLSDYLAQHLGCRQALIEGRSINPAPSQITSSEILLEFDEEIPIPRVTSYVGRFFEEIDFETFKLDHDERSFSGTFRIPGLSWKVVGKVRSSGAKPQLLITSK